MPKVADFDAMNFFTSPDTRSLCIAFNRVAAVDLFTFEFDLILVSVVRLNPESRDKYATLIPVT